MSKPRDDASDLRRRIVGTFLRDARVRAGLTQLDVARVLKLATAQYVSNWERGVALPPMKTLRQVVDALQIDPTELVDVFSHYQSEVARQESQELRALLMNRAPSGKRR